MTATRVRIFDCKRCKAWHIAHTAGVEIYQTNAPGHPFDEFDASGPMNGGGSVALYATRSTAERAARFDGMEVVE